VDGRIAAAGNELCAGVKRRDEVTALAEMQENNSATTGLLRNKKRMDTSDL
jgi:hypothetical protein